MPADPAQIAKGLTAAQRGALMTAARLALLSLRVQNCIRQQTADALVSRGLIRPFTRVLTPLGHAVRAHLQKDQDNER